MRLERIGAVEIVFLRSIFRTELIEILIRHQLAVCRLPGTNMNSRHGDCIRWFCVSELHMTDGKAW
jgi:hypothetical protein